MPRTPKTGLTINHGALSAMVSTPLMAAAMRERAQFGLEFARAEATRRAFDKGEYAAAFEVSDAIVKVNGLNRSVAYLTNTDPKAWAVEWGHGGHHIMQQTVDVMTKKR